MKKINWFGRTYYGDTNKNETYKRPIYIAFKMWLEHDIIDKITGAHYHMDDKGYWRKKVYRWNCKTNHIVKL